MLLIENTLHLWQTTILVNIRITIPIKYELTRSTKHLPKPAAYIMRSLRKFLPHRYNSGANLQAI